MLDAPDLEHGSSWHYHIGGIIRYRGMTLMHRPVAPKGTCHKFLGSLYPSTQTPTSNSSDICDDLKRVVKAARALAWQSKA